ncbi:unnamed protein product, partial [Nesidiocoris tenuis]
MLVEISSQTVDDASKLPRAPRLIFNPGAANNISAAASPTRASLLVIFCNRKSSSECWSA